MALDFWLSDDAGCRREAFGIGRTVFVAGRGLVPRSPYAFWLGKELLARYLTDRHGALPPTPLMPYPGLVHAGGCRTHGEALEALSGQALTIRVAGPRDSTGELRLAFHADREPWLFPCDAKGRLRTGMVAGREPITLALHGFPAGCLRVFTVARQFGWRAGDAFEPLAVHTFAHDGARTHRIELPGGLRPGSYQFIARTFPPGADEAGEAILLPGDVVSDRRFASLVLRSGRIPAGNGLILTPELAGRPLPHRPYFRFDNTFPLGTDVYAALDPDHLPPGLVGQRAAIYVIRHKTAAQWASSSALEDITGPGLSSEPKVVPIVPGCVNWNTTLVWPDPQALGDYDIVLDFGNNAADPAAFASDASLDPPLDMIDGYVRVGFRVSRDPSLPGPITGIGSHDYALPSIQVPSTDAGPSPTDTLPLTATIRYPATSSGADAPFLPGSFPLAVIMHGNSGYDTSYLGYDYLLDHLASHGFVAMSIYAPVGVMIETRARAILAHLGIMAQNNANPGLFFGHLDFSKVGICGHSRGAEAVVRASRINQAEALGWNLKAGVSIAPTDYHHYGDPFLPLLVIYGSNDGDVAGTWPDRTCFDIYDEAGRPRSFAFVYGATHDRFNSVWAPTSLTVESDIAPGDVAGLLSQTQHEGVAKGYVTAFLEGHLLGMDGQLDYLRSGLKPSLASGIPVHTSHQEPGALLVDDFEQLPHDPAHNTLGEGVTGTALTTLGEGALRTLDIHSPHVTAGGNLAWATGAGSYRSLLPPGSRDVSGFAVLAFRVTQKFGSPLNQANQALEFYVRLTDGAGRSRAVRTSSFTDIPYPYLRGFTDLIKSALKTVRIPLVSYTIANAGAQDVDLTDLRSVAFEFDLDATGEIEIDDIEFSA